MTLSESVDATFTVQILFVGSVPMKVPKEMISSPAFAISLEVSAMSPGLSSTRKLTLTPLVLAPKSSMRILKRSLLLTIPTSLSPSTTGRQERSSVHRLFPYRSLPGVDFGFRRTPALPAACPEIHHHRQG